MTAVQLKQCCGPNCWLKAASKEQKTAISGNELILTDEHDASIGDSMMQAIQLLYKPLAPEQIRLLMILPGAFDDPIECELRRATITMRDGARLDEPYDDRNMVQYDALSYSWGSPAYTCSVICNGIKFPVTRHLKDALIHLRSAVKVRYLWTDAFCIQQTDLVEKGGQVQLMFAIFQKADQVVGWIGRVTGEHRNLMRYIHAYAAIDHTQHNIPDNYESLRQVAANGQGYEHDDICRSLLAHVQTSARGFIDQMSWFHRTWIRQEVYAAKSIIMVCGKFLFRLRHLAVLAGPKLPQTFRVLTGSAKHGVHHENISMFLTGRRTGEHSTSDWWMHAVFQNTEGFQATVDHDRIFALQNVAQPNTAEHARLFPILDYSMDFNTLSSNFVKRVMKASRCLTAITIFEDRTGSLQGLLPSWTTDFRLQKPRLVEYDRHEKSMEHKYKSLLQINADLPDPEQGVLRLPGFKLGHVGRRSNLPTSDEFSLTLLTFSTGNSRHSYQARRSEIPNTMFYAAVRNVRHTIPWQEGMPLPPRRTDRWKMAQDIIDEVGYECRFWVVDDAEYTSPHRFSNFEHHSPWPATIETRILVTKIAEEGDIVVSFPTWKDLLGDDASKPSRMTYAYILRSSNTSPGKYHYLGPCIVIRRYKFALPAPGSEWNYHFGSKERQPDDGAKVEREDEQEYKDSTGYTWEDHLFTQSIAWRERLNQGMEEFALI